MKTYLFGAIVIISLITTSCNNQKKVEAIRNNPSTQSLLQEIKSRDDVSEAIISDAGGLCIAMIIDDKKTADFIARYYLWIAKKEKIEISYCKIISFIDYETDGKTFMSGKSLAFESQNQ